MVSLVKTAFVGLTCYYALKTIDKKDYGKIIGFLVILSIGIQGYNLISGKVSYIFNGGWLDDLFSKIDNFKFW